MFEKLIGNQAVKDHLERLISKGRMPHALLFSGPDGIGKKHFALDAARSFVCVDARSPFPCEKCGACLRVDTIIMPKAEDRDAHKLTVPTGHTDVKLVVPYKRNILIDAIRDLEHEANFRPFEARARVFIVDDADKMNDAASNALLKTLEEPAETSYIFLITSRPDKLLQTIRSRCQQVRFAPVAAEEIETVLTVRAGLSADDARLAARLAAGSVSRAMSIDIELHKTRRDQMLEILTAAAAGDRAFLLQRAETLNSAKYKDDLEEVLSILEDLVRDVWLAQKRADAAAFTNVDIAPEIGRIAMEADRAPFAQWLEEIEQMRNNFSVNINRKIATDALFMKMTT